MAANNLRPEYNLNGVLKRYCLGVGARARCARRALSGGRWAMGVGGCPTSVQADG